MAKAKAASDSLDDLLDNANAASGSKKKSEVPVLEITDPVIAENMAKWAQANKDIDTAEAIKASIESNLLPTAQDFHQKVVSQTRKVPSTVKLNSPTINMLVDVAKNQYKVIQLTEEDKLKTVFGAEDFDQCFVKATEIKLTDAALADKEILVLLIKAVGQENFNKYFEVKRVFKPTEGLHIGRFTDAALKVKADKAIDAGLLAPYKPSFKAKA